MQESIAAQNLRKVLAYSNLVKGFLLTQFIFAQILLTDATLEPKFCT